MSTRLPVPNPKEMTAVNYASTSCPTAYHCGMCGVHGVKLWRLYQTFLNHQSLLCATCACAEQTTTGKAYSVRQGNNGRVRVTTIYDPVVEPRLHQMFGGKDESGDQIGWRIPAVPTEEGDTYWGYTSVPAAGCTWWNALPLDKGGSQ